MKCEFCFHSLSIKNTSGWICDSNNEFAHLILHCDLWKFSVWSTHGIWIWKGVNVDESGPLWFASETWNVNLVLTKLLAISFGAGSKHRHLNSLSFIELFYYRFGSGKIYSEKVTKFVMFFSVSKFNNNPKYVSNVKLASTGWMTKKIWFCETFRHYT